jgi:hypothetical protein
MAILVKTEDSEVIYKEPETFTSKNVQFYCHHAKELKQTQIHKAQQFVDFDCIRYVGDDGEFKDKYSFVVLPLNTEPETKYECRTFTKKPFKTDYNHNVYTIAKSQEYKNTFACNCQAWITRHKKGEIKEEGSNCSHILALYFCFKMRRFGEKT